MKKRLLAVLFLLCLILPISSTALAASINVKKIKLNTTQLSVEVGDKVQLYATITPNNASNKKVTWKSSNSKVATVSSSGIVTAKSTGTATITVTSNSNSSVKATCKVTVQAVQPTKVALNKTSLELVGGKQYTLKATVSPSSASQKVTWKSSNTKVATVSSSGVVTPKGYGTAKITATTANGKKAASCTVTVPKTKVYTKTYTVASEWPYYMKDNISVVVDGLTGKIVSYDCYQSKRDVGVICLINKDGCKVIYACDDYIRVRTTWTVKLGLFWKFTTDAVTVSSEYIMYKDGTMERVSYSRK